MAWPLVIIEFAGGDFHPEGQDFSRELFQNRRLGRIGQGCWRSGWRRAGGLGGQRGSGQIASGNARRGILQQSRGGRRVTRGGAPESLWSQIKAEGISGPAAAKPLRTLPVELTTWQDWRTRHPGTLVLSPQTGHRRSYERNPYQGYFSQPALMFPAQPTSDRLPAKARVLGVWTSGAARAYPESAFNRQKSRVEDEVGGKKVVIAFNPDAESLRVLSAEEGVQWMYALWFTWYAFHPETTVFEWPRP